MWKGSIEHPPDFRDASLSFFPFPFSPYFIPRTYWRALRCCQHCTTPQFVLQSGLLSNAGISPFRLRLQFLDAGRGTSVGTKWQFNVEDGFFPFPFSIVLWPRTSHPAPHTLYPIQVNWLISLFVNVKRVNRTSAWFSGRIFILFPFSFFPILHTPYLLTSTSLLSALHHPAIRTSIRVIE